MFSIDITYSRTYLFLIGRSFNIIFQYLKNVICNVLDILPYLQVLAATTFGHLQLRRIEPSVKHGRGSTYFSNCAPVRNYFL